MKKAICMCILSVILLVAVFCVIMMPDSVSLALNESSIEEICARLTQTDTPNNQNIHDYVEEFEQHATPRMPTTGAIIFSRGRDFLNNCQYSVGVDISVDIYGDDNITKLFLRNYSLNKMSFFILEENMGFILRQKKRAGILKAM